MKKIFICISSLKGGGAERAALGLANFLSKKDDYDLYILTFSQHSEILKELECRVKWFSVDRNKITKKIKLLKLFYFVYYFYKFKPACVISFMPYMNIISFFSSVLFKTKVILAERVDPSAMPLSLFYDFLRKIAYNNCDYVVTQTADINSWVQSYATNATVVTIPNFIRKEYPTVNVENLSNYNLDNKKFIHLLAVGRLVNQKGFDILIHSISIATKTVPNLRLHICGSGNELSNLTRLRNKLGLRDSIFFHKYVDDISYFYKNCDIFVLSSRFEGFPNVLLEAMSFGMPSVAFKGISGVDSIINNNINGVIVDHTSCPNFLSDGIVNLAKNMVFRNNVSKNAKLISNVYAMPVIAHKWISLINE